MQFTLVSYCEGYNYVSYLGEETLTIESSHDITCTDTLEDLEDEITQFNVNVMNQFFFEDNSKYFWFNPDIIKHTLLVDGVQKHKHTDINEKFLSIIFKGGIQAAVLINNKLNKVKEEQEAKRILLQDAAHQIHLKHLAKTLSTKDIEDIINLKN